jgi:hypothetical protein
VHSSEAWKGGYKNRLSFTHFVRTYFHFVLFIPLPYGEAEYGILDILYSYIFAVKKHKKRQ